MGDVLDVVGCVVDPLLIQTSGRSYFRIVQRHTRGEERRLHPRIGRSGS